MERTDLYMELDINEWEKYRRKTLRRVRLITIVCLVLVPLLELYLLSSYKNSSILSYIGTYEFRCIALASWIIIIFISIIYRVRLRNKVKRGLESIAKSLNINIHGTSINGKIGQLRREIAARKKEKDNLEKRRLAIIEEAQREQAERRAYYLCISNYSGLSNTELKEAIAKAEIEFNSVKQEALEYGITNCYETIDDLKTAVQIRKQETLISLRAQAKELGIPFTSDSIPTLKRKIDIALEEKRKREEQKKAELKAQQERIQKLRDQALKLGIGIPQIKQIGDSESQLNEVINQANQIRIDNLKKEATDLGISLGKSESIFSLKIKIANKKREIEQQKKAEEEARLAEQKRKEEEERQRALLFEEAARYGIPVNGRSDSSIKFDLNQEKARLAQIERERKAEEERKKKLREEEEKRQRLLKCVSSWYEPSRSYLKCFSMYNYYPTTCGWDVSQEDWNVRNLIWNFKANPHRPMPLSTIMALHENSAKIVGKSMCKVLRHFFGYDVNSLTLLCIPASSKEITQRRYEDFSKMVCDESGMSNGYNHVRVDVDGGAKHLGQSNSAQYSIDTAYFKGRFIILFDDVITSGGSMEKFRQVLESNGAHVIGGFSIGRTRHEPQDSHPINNI